MKNLLLLLPFLSLTGCNTRIGWPGHYLSQGFWSTCGYFVVCLLFALSLVLIKELAEQEKGGSLGPPVAALVLGLFLLQLLPESDSGIVVLPGVPTSYANGFGCLVAMMAWICIALTVVKGLSGDNDSPQVCSLLVSVCLASCLLLSFFGRTHEEPELPVQMKSIEETGANSGVWEQTETTVQLEQWQEKRKMVQDTVAHLQSECADVQSHLERNHEHDEAADTLSAELEELTGQINLMNHIEQSLVIAIVRVQSYQRRLERLKQLEQIEEVDFAELDRIRFELTEQIRQANRYHGSIVGGRAVGGGSSGPVNP